MSSVSLVATMVGFGYAELLSSSLTSLDFDSTIAYQLPEKRMLKPAFIKRLSKEFADINNNSKCGYKATLEDGDIQNWIVEFQGPEDSPYEGLKFRLRIRITVRTASVCFTCRMVIRSNPLTFIS